MRQNPLLFWTVGSVLFQYGIRYNNVWRFFMWRGALFTSENHVFQYKHTLNPKWTASRQEDSDIIKGKFTALRRYGTRRFHMAADASIRHLRVSFMQLTDTACASLLESRHQGCAGGAWCCSNHYNLRSSSQGILGRWIAFRSIAHASEYPETFHWLIIGYTGHALLHSSFFEHAVEGSARVLEPTVTVKQRMGVRVCGSCDTENIKD